MGKINWGRVIVGGLLAGVVLNAFGYVYYGVVMKSDMAAAMQALGKQPQAIDALVPWFIFLDFIYGIGLLWVYAAIRPRFGAGPKTGVIAGVAVWFFIALLHNLGEAPMGLYPQRMYVTGTIVALVQYALAGPIGAYLYRSEEHTSELQSQSNLVCRLLLEKKNTGDELVAERLERVRHHRQPGLRIGAPGERARDVGQRAPFAPQLAYGRRQLPGAVSCNRC